jgi:hypothetical protein
MPELKLAKLPDRAPVKIMFRASPDLARMLNDYCDAYRAIYEQPDETVEELIPFMLAAFMDGDPQFKKARKRARKDTGAPTEIGSRENTTRSAAQAATATTMNC